MITKKLENLEKWLENHKEKFRENLPYLLLFGLIFVILFAMHHLVALYFDDFGNASLSYGQTSFDVIGTNYSASQLWNWCKMIYRTWGGRILWAALILIPLLKFGASLYFAIQSVVITLILYVIFKIAEYITKEKNILIPIFLMILYGLFHIYILRNGVYWASASILYIWPLLPLFLFIYLYMKLTDKIKNNEKINYFVYVPILLLVNFFATFSQEQISVAMLAFLILYIIFYHGREWRKYKKLDIPNLIVCLAGFALLMLAPGNYARLDTNVEFASLSLFGKIYKNFPTLLLVIFRSEMTIYMIILTIIFLLCIVKYRKEFSIHPKKTMLSIFLFVCMSVLCIFLQRRYKVVGVLYGILWILFIGVWMLIYGFQRKKLSIPILAISGCGSIFCLVVSPVLGGRTSLPFIFYIFLLITIFTNELLKNSKNYMILCFMILMIPLAFKSALNYKVIYNGYLENYGIEKLNYRILQKHNGTQEKEITLYKSLEPFYGVSRSYQEPSIEYWMKEYFNIPQEVEFKYVDIYESVR